MLALCLAAVLLIAGVMLISRNGVIHTVGIASIGYGTGVAVVGGLLATGWSRKSE